MPTPTMPTPTMVRLYRHMVAAGHEPTVFSNRFPNKGKRLIHAVGKQAGVLSPAPHKPNTKKHDQLVATQLWIKEFVMNYEGPIPRLTTVSEPQPWALNPPTTYPRP